MPNKSDPAEPDKLRLLSFTVRPGQEWKITCQVAPVPASWVAKLRDEWHGHRGRSPETSLPTRGLIELVLGVDPAMIYMHWDLNDAMVLFAFDGVDTDVVAAAFAAWATTEVSDPHSDIDWFTELHGEDLHFSPREFNLLEHTTRANGVAFPSRAMYWLLPTFLAQHVVQEKPRLLGLDRQYILGPPDRTGRRSVVLWEPEKITDPKAGDGLFTAKITFHVETSPEDPVPHVHADLTSSRFPLMPVTYVPARGDGPPQATVWLHAPDGFLRRHEPHTLLAATARQIRRDGIRQWLWAPGLARALANLTHLPFPAPGKVFEAPAAATSEGAIRAYVLYSEGTKSLADDTHEPDETEDGIRKAKSLRHAAQTGFVPADHIEVHTQLTGLFHEYLEPTDLTTRVGSRAERQIKISIDPDEVHQLHLMTQSDLTREAVLGALEHHLQLTPTLDPDTGVMHFRGHTAIDVALLPAGDIPAGVRPDPDRDRTASSLLGIRANQVERMLGTSSEPVTVILELNDAAHFGRAKLIDPKPALKKAFARTDRRLQCLRPAVLFKPPATWISTKKAPPAPYPGTRFSKGTIHRAGAAVNDALRQLGRIGAFEMPAALAPMELIGIWLHHGVNAVIPLVVRIATNGEVLAYLAGRQDDEPTVIAYRNLPRALAAGQGRIPSGPRQKAIVSTFLRNALGISDTGAVDRHDRIAFVRALSFRNWGWDWLQDKHVLTDRLILPGVELKDGSPPRLFTPADLHGLRIVRVRERSSNMETALGFAATGRYVRASGLFHASGRTYYSVNPKPDQNQVPNAATKLDPAQTGNYTKHAANPVPLEVFPAFLQADDDPHAVALFTSLLRRAHLHTGQATTHPAPVHLCGLADEYL